MEPTDVYTLPHKALRYAVSYAGTRLAAADAESGSDALDIALAVVEELEAHAAHEDEFIGPVLARFLPAVATGITAQHAQLDVHLVGLRRGLDRLHARREVAPADLLELYRSFERFSATNLAHLDHEETVVLPMLTHAAPAAAVGEIMVRFRAAHPDANDLYRRWPDPLSSAERRLVGVA